MSDSYFTFPLAVLNGPINSGTITPRLCMEAAISFGMFNAGRGYCHNHGEDAFKDRFNEECEKYNLRGQSKPGWTTPAADILVGAALCGVTIGGNITEGLKRHKETISKVPHDPPFVRMASNTLWAAVDQARAESGDGTKFPERGISWREFRILCAILSVKLNRADFSFIGWETIQARACGFVTKEAFKARTVTPEHLAPPLSRKQIRATLDALECLGFFARFRLSQGPKGGLTAYSFRHDREELARAVCDTINFRDRAKVRENRAADVEKCLKLLERAKSGPSVGQQ